jgi:hypothetical protein
MEPHNIDYPAEDDRFRLTPEDMTLDQVTLWTLDIPPAPEFNPAEKYTEFTKRQTAYASYRNAVVTRRDALQLQEKRLLIPKAPVGEDVQAAIDWIQATGATPLEFLAKTYRNDSVPVALRISAASKLMDYVHKKLPTTTITEKPLDDDAIAAQRSLMRDIEVMFADKLKLKAK